MPASAGGGRLAGLTGEGAVHSRKYRKVGVASTVDATPTSLTVPTTMGDPVSAQIYFLTFGWNASTAGYRPPSSGETSTTANASSGNCGKAESAS